MLQVHVHLNINDLQMLPDADECMGRPCMHAFACRNRIGDYLCDCQPGWTGKNCDVSKFDSIINSAKFLVLFDLKLH